MLIYPLNMKLYCRSDPLVVVLEKRLSSLLHALEDHKAYVNERVPVPKIATPKATVDTMMIVFELGSLQLSISFARTFPLLQLLQVA